MPRIDETSYGAHGFTVDWWQELPEAFRVADRVQGETLAPAWDGLNRDPRFVTGFDGWDRANTSTQPWVVSFTMTRTFKVTPNVPVLVRSWHTPYLVGTTTVAAVDVRHTIRDYKDATVATTTGKITTEHGSLDTWVTPDRFGQLTVTVEVTLDMGRTSVDPAARDTMDVLAAIHVGTRDVSFDELPDLASFTINKPYPLLRFMDGVGHQAGFLDDQLAHMWDGDTFNPVSAPEQWLRFLGTIMGLPRTYMGRLTLAQLRSHLVAFVENGRPLLGHAGTSRRSRSSGSPATGRCPWCLPLSSLAGMVGRTSSCCRPSRAPPPPGKSPSPPSHPYPLPNTSGPAPVEHPHPCNSPTETRPQRT